MTKDVKIDEEDATIVGKIVVPILFVLLISIIVQQYWQNLMWNQQVAVVIALMLFATFVYRKELREMIYD